MELHEQIFWWLSKSFFWRSFVFCLFLLFFGDSFLIFNFYCFLGDQNFSLVPQDSDSCFNDKIFDWNRPTFFYKNCRSNTWEWHFWFTDVSVRKCRAIMDFLRLENMVTVWKSLIFHKTHWYIWNKPIWFLRRTKKMFIATIS